MLRSIFYLLISILPLKAITCIAGNDLKEFNLKGNVRKHISNTYLIGYDNDGVIICGELDSSSCNYTSFYDKTGHLIDDVRVFPGMEIVEKCSFRYDQNNRLTESLKLDDNDNLYSRTVFNWQDDKLAEEIEYDEKEMLTRRIVYQSDSSNLRRCTLYYQDEIPSNVYVREMDDEKIIRETELDYKGAVTYTQLNHFDGEHLMKVEYISELGTEIHSFEYNQHGYIAGVRVVFDNIPSQQLYYEYEYDKHRNWTKRIEFSGEERAPQSITINEFEYW